MKKIIYVIIIALLVSFNLVHGEEDFAQAEKLIKQKIPCNELTNNQLEILGDYYMEQMHPGELHEIMDERMGGEGSESLRQVHINMGKMFYCGEQGAMPTSMMNMMMGRGMNNFNMIGYYNTRNNTVNVLGMIIAVLILIILVFIIIVLMRNINYRDKRKHG